MTKRKLILIQIISLFIIVALAFAFIYDFSTRRIFDTDYLLVTIIFSFFLLLIGFGSAFIISSLIKGEYIKSFFQDFLKWTIPISLFLGLYILYDWQMGIKYRYREDNLAHNEKYKNFYEDSRDENIKLVIEKVENQLDNKGDYRIVRMRVLEKDTIINERHSSYYDIHQIYYIGRRNYKNNTYFARHIVLNKNINELNFNTPISSSSIIEKVSAIDTLVKRMMTNQTMEDITKVSVNLLEDVIKLKE